MKDITLPVLPQDTPIRAVIAVMHQVRRSAVVTKVGDSVRLIRAGDVIESRNAATLGNVKHVKLSTAASGAPHIENVCGHEWALCGPERTVAIGPAKWQFDQPRFQSIFDTSQDNYVLERLGLGAAIVITRSEDFEAELNGEPADCYCAGSRRHPYAQAHPGICPRDQQPIQCW